MSVAGLQGHPLTTHVGSSRLRHHRGAGWVPSGRKDKHGRPGPLTPSQSWSRDRHFGSSVRASWELGNQPAQLLGLLLQHMENLTKSRNQTSPSENRQNSKHQETQTRSNTRAGAGRWLVP